MAGVCHFKRFGMSAAQECVAKSGLADCAKGLLRPGIGRERTRHHDLIGFAFAIGAPDPNRQTGLFQPQGCFLSVRRHTEHADLNQALTGGRYDRFAAGLGPASARRPPRSGARPRARSRAPCTTTQPRQVSCLAGLFCLQRFRAGLPRISKRPGQRRTPSSQDG